MKAVADSFVMMPRGWRATLKVTTLWLSSCRRRRAKGVAEEGLHGVSEAEKDALPNDRIELLREKDLGDRTRLDERLARIHQFWYPRAQIWSVATYA